MGARLLSPMSESVPPLRVVAIIAAGGQGNRLGAGAPKQFLEIGGRTMLDRSIAAFDAHPRVAALVVALPAAVMADPPACLGACAKPLQLVAGGERRQDSVARAFEAIEPPADVVVVHDAARPFVDAATIDRTIDAAIESGAAIAALPSRDTVKLARDDAAGAWVAETIPRERVWLAQTPQAFRRDVLAAALALGARGGHGTDEAALAEQAGHTVRLVDGNPRNIKITTQADLELARAALAREAQPASHDVNLRIGMGYDSHRLVQGRPLVLGGVAVPHTSGLAGYSDADALCHAITDAVLGAAALGDIGRHFPDTDPRWRDADSLDLVRRAASLLRAAGFNVVNVDAVVIADQPKLAPFVDAMRVRLADALGLEAGAVSVKGKTNEGMGETGRGEGIAVHAVALVARR
jgi:2-C-methyl-D-erythritol 4-phosphate cytidylyltransferase/2-C-methyl-D-erythritol 2,4-cyclodiphosphate synthase